jgi:hypothetical protein
MTRSNHNATNCADCADPATFCEPIDLAFPHFADFGQDADIVRLLSSVIDDTAAPILARRRLDKLRASTSSDSNGTGQRFDTGRPGPTEN